MSANTSQDNMTGDSGLGSKGLLFVSTCAEGQLSLDTLWTWV